MNTNKCVDCDRDLSIWDLEENLKGRAFSGVINNTCPDCISKRCAESMKNELQKKEKDEANAGE